MPAPVARSLKVADDGNHTRPRRWWISRISREQERRLYFLATIVLAAWHLITRLF